MMKEILLWTFLFIGCVFMSYGSIKRGIRLKKQGEDLNLVHVSVVGNASLDIIVKTVCALVSLGILIQYIVKAIQK